MNQKWAEFTTEGDAYLKTASGGAKEVCLLPGYEILLPGQSLTIVSIHPDNLT